MRASLLTCTGNMHGQENFINCYVVVLPKLDIGNMPVETGVLLSNELNYNSFKKK